MYCTTMNQADSYKWCNVYNIDYLPLQQLLDDVKGHQNEAEFIEQTLDFVLEHSRKVNRDEISRRAMDFTQRYKALHGSLGGYVKNLQVLDSDSHTLTIAFCMFSFPSSHSVFYVHYFRFYAKLHLSFHFNAACLHTLISLYSSISIFHSPCFYILCTFWHSIPHVAVLTFPGFHTSMEAVQWG